MNQGIRNNNNNINRVYQMNSVQSTVFCVFITIIIKWKEFVSEGSLQYHGFPLDRQSEQDHGRFYV